MRHTKQSGKRRKQQIIILFFGRWKFREKYPKKPPVGFFRGNYGVEKNVTEEFCLMIPFLHFYQAEARVAELNRNKSLLESSFEGVRKASIGSNEG